MFWHGVKLPFSAVTIYGLHECCNRSFDRYNVIWFDLKNVVFHASNPMFRISYFISYYSQITHPMFHIPCFISHVSHPMYQIPCLKSHVSYPMFHIPCFVSHVLNPIFQTPCFKSYVSNLTFHIPCFTSHVSHPMFHIPCFISHVHIHVSYPMFSAPSITSVSVGSSWVHMEPSICWITSQDRPDSPVWHQHYMIHIPCRGVGCSSIVGRPRWWKQLFATIAVSSECFLFSRV